MKQCSKCKQLKPFEAFGRRGDNFRRRNQCTACRVIQNKAIRDKNRAHYIEYYHKRYQALKKTVWYPQI